MCGIVGAIAERPVEKILIEGLKRLEYRGYDSAGMAILDPESNAIRRARVLGKVAGLIEALQAVPLSGYVGIAHTRWATHGRPNETNAHPHCSKNKIAIVHNGIIENYQALREKLIKLDYEFESETDTEVVAHLLHHHLDQDDDMEIAIQKTAAELKGAYALCILFTETPDRFYAVRSGSPLVVGLGIGENFIASDQLALLPVTQKFIYLEEGDIAIVSCDDVRIIDSTGKMANRKTHESEPEADAASKGKFRHFMLKEIYDQPTAIARTLERYLTNSHINPEQFGHQASKILSTVKRVQIIACGTSFHAALVAKYWMEAIAKIPTQVEVASEFRYRDSIMEPDTLFIAISQSGETADTLAAVRHAKKIGCKAVLSICNVPESSLSRESDLLCITQSGREIGVAATKTFTAQLSALALLTLVLSQFQGLAKKDIANYIRDLESLPDRIDLLLKLDKQIQVISKQFIYKKNALFIARGEFYPIALEGALKLKEISYVHAEGYPAGELKHGPLALVDEEMPVIVIAPNNKLFDKLASNLQEIQARGGQLFVLSNKDKSAFDAKTILIPMPDMPDLLAPICYTIPLQLLSYHIAVLKGTDVDQPRNLAKSVTVE